MIGGIVCFFSQVMHCSAMVLADNVGPSWRTTFECIDDIVVHESPVSNHAEYLPERRQMMQAWADYLDKLKAGAEVIQLNPKVA